MNVKSLQNKLDQVQLDYLMIGYHFEAISSIFNYPKEYELGKKSVGIRPCIYNHKIKTLEEMKFYEESGECPTCFVMDQYRDDDYFCGYEDEDYDL